MILRICRSLFSGLSPRPISSIVPTPYLIYRAGTARTESSSTQIRSHSDLFQPTEIPSPSEGSLPHRNRQKQKAKRTATLLPKALSIIQRPTQNFFTSDQPLFRDVQGLGSYSWTSAQSPTIVVPGHPRIWASPVIPFTVQEDRGRSLVDQNRQRLPVHPLLPLVATLDHIVSIGHPNTRGFNFTSVDIVTDRNNLHKLTKWAGGSTGGDTDFTIDAECAGRTIFFTRREPKTSVWTHQGSYGHNFEKVTTVARAADITSYHRIVTYSFGGLKLLVRCEIDACLAEDGFEPPPEGSRQPRVSKRTIPGGLELISDGTFVAQSRMMELTTRNLPVRSRIKDKAYVQLALGQVQNHVTGWHENGKFSEVQLTDLATLNERFSTSGSGKKLRKLATALPLICQEIRSQPHGTLMSLICNRGVLSLCQRHGAAGAAHALPDCFLNRFGSSTV